jgi:hypothetical protein
MNWLTGWVVGKATDDILKNRLGVTDTRKRQRVVREVKQLVKSPKKEPVLYGGIVGVAVALLAAFGLDLEPTQLTVTITTVITIVTFIQRKLVSPKDKE